MSDKQIPHSNGLQKFNVGKLSIRIFRLITFGLLLSAILVLDLLGFGFINITGLLEITILLIPVIIGAIALSVRAGVILSMAFGLVSFIQTFGRNPSAHELMLQAPVATLFLCIGVRMAVGLFIAVLFRLMTRHQRPTELSFVPFWFSALCGSLLHTILFSGFLITLFYDMLFSMGIDRYDLARNLITNGIFELVICTIIGGSISKAVHNLFLTIE